MKGPVVNGPASRDRRTLTAMSVSRCPTNMDTSDDHSSGPINPHREGDPF